MIHDLHAQKKTSGHHARVLFDEVIAAVEASHVGVRVVKVMKF